MDITRSGLITIERRISLSQLSGAIILGSTEPTISFVDKSDPLYNTLNLIYVTECSHYDIVNSTSALQPLYSRVGLNTSETGGLRRRF